MKILVCVKQVLDLEEETDFHIDDSGQSMVFDGPPVYQLNRFDDCAIEEALLIKKAHTETLIDVITVGPERADAVLRRAMGMGVDNGIHIMTSGEEIPNSFQIATWIGEYSKEQKYDLIFTGVMSEDEMQGQVGPMLAEVLGMPCATSVIKETMMEGNDKIRVEREIEGGYRDVLELLMPAVLTIQTGINQPRYPSLSNVLRAKKTEVNVIPSTTIAIPDKRQTIAKLNYPQKTRSAIRLEGSRRGKAEALLRIFKEKSIL